MAKQLTSNQTLLAKYGGTPDATNVVTMSENVFFSPKVKNGETNDIGTGAGSGKGYVVPDWTTVDGTISLNLRASGAAGDAPACAEMLKICSLAETIDAGVSAAYNPSVPLSSNGTIVDYIDGAKRTITGVVGNLKASFRIGEIAKITADIKGFTDAAPSAEANPTVTLDSNSNMIVTSVDAVTIGGTTINLTSADFDMGAVIEESYATGNEKEFYIQDFKPTITLNDIKAKGNEAHWTDLSAGNIKEIIITLGSTGGKIAEFKASYCSYFDVGESDNKGAVNIKRTFKCESSAGGDNFTFTWK